MMTSSDPDKVHQIVFRSNRKRMYVSCRCRAVLGKHSRNPPDDYYEPMEVKEGESFFETYNRPENHFTEFTPQDWLKI